MSMSLEVNIDQISSHKFLPKNPQDILFIFLSSNNNNFSEEDIALFGEQLPIFINLKVLILLELNISVKSAQILAPSLPKTLTELNMAISNLYDEGVTAIANQFQNLPNLKTLNLSLNKFGNVGCIALNDQLNHCPKLEQLNLLGNFYTEDMTEKLAVTVQSLPHMYMFNVDHDKDSAIFNIVDSTTYNSYVSTMHSNSAFCSREDESSYDDFQSTASGENSSSDSDWDQD